VWYIFYRYQKEYQYDDTETTKQGKRTMVVPANQILKRGQVKLTNLPTREYDRSKDIQAAKDGDPDAQARVKMIDSIKARHNRDKRK
jgi:hypothetical protein